MQVITVGNTSIEYSIRKSDKSKKITINVTPDDVEVVIPTGVDESKAIDFVNKKRNWVYEQRESLLELKSKKNNESISKYMTGTKILYRGRRVKLTVVPDGLYNIKVNYHYGFNISIPPSDVGEHADHYIKRALDKWFKLKAYDECRLLVLKYSKKIGVEAKGIRIKEQKHLWGSCGHDHILNFNWRLLRAPRRVLEYVVAHEVCHLKYRNHSDDFWTILSTVFNETDDCKKWLEREGITI